MNDITAKPAAPPLPAIASATDLVTELQKFVSGMARCTTPTDAAELLERRREYAKDYRRPLSTVTEDDVLADLSDDYLNGEATALWCMIRAARELMARVEAEPLYAVVLATYVSGHDYYVARLVDVAGERYALMVGYDPNCVAPNGQKGGWRKFTRKADAFKAARALGPTLPGVLIEDRTKIIMNAVKPVVAS
jgi:hypothetical protein